MALLVGCDDFDLVGRRCSRRFAIRYGYRSLVPFDDGCAGDDGDVASPARKLRGLMGCP